MIGEDQGCWQMTIVGLNEITLHYITSGCQNTGWCMRVLEREELAVLVNISDPRATRMLSESI